MDLRRKAEAQAEDLLKRIRVRRIGRETGKTNRYLQCQLAGKPQ